MLSQTIRTLLLAWVLLLAAALPTLASASAATNQIKINQVGFVPSAQKLAVVPASGGDRFAVVRLDTEEPVYRGTLGPAATWPYSAESVRIADFSGFTQPGVYRLRVEGLPDSPVFHIASDIYRDLNRAAIKALYFNRASTELLEEHAGIYARPAGHPDDRVKVHWSAASDERPEGTIISAPKGWYDAGDYNKYIVNSGITMYTLLAAYEHFPELYRKQDLNIPESGDGVPDLLNEIMWNLEWMFDMQDPHDGGVYHKLTTERFQDAVMPHTLDAQRYVVTKGTAAALNFAAVMAQASRVYAGYESHFPGLSARALRAAEHAWAWAQEHPDITFTNPEGVVTGQYGDRTLSDEFAWAAAELYITTGQDEYYVAMNPSEVANAVPSWSQSRGLAWMSLAHHRDGLTELADRDLIASRVTELADQLLQVWRESAYRVVMQRGNFVWGSNGVALNNAMMLIQGYRVSGNREYLNAAQSNLDYVLGRNATDFSFVTGYGSKPPMHIHHRVSEADGIEHPVPGFIAGGPQPAQQDRQACLEDYEVEYQSSLPAKSYLDHWCSYASNEIAINWNAPLVYVSGALQVLTR